MTPRRVHKSRKSPIAVQVDGELLRLNKATGQAYFLLPDPERDGAKVRHYQGRFHASCSPRRGSVPGATSPSGGPPGARWAAATGSRRSRSGSS